MDNRLKNELTISCYNTDCSFRMKPSAFMDFAQDMAYHAAGMFNFGYEDLQKQGTVWVLSRMHIHFKETPKWLDEVEMTTWHKGLDGLYFLRDFSMNSKDGTPMVAATSSWVVINKETRRFVRSDELESLFDESAICKDNAIETPAPKVIMPRGINPEKVGEHKVSYSDVDFIGHTNNARYIVWAMDAIDYEITSKRQLSDLVINFSHETTQGQVVELFRHKVETVNDELKYIVEGKTDGKTAFCVELSFK